MDRWKLCMRASTWLILAQVWVSQPKLATEVTVEGDFPGRSVWKRTLVWEASCATSGSRWSSLTTSEKRPLLLPGSEWVACPAQAGGRLHGNLRLQPSWLTLTDPELEKQSGTHRAGTGNPSESLFGQSENMRQLPTEQSAPKGVEGTSKSGQGPCRAGETTSVHKAGAEVTWFGSHPLIRKRSWFCCDLNNNKKKQKVFWFKKKPLKG